MMDRDHEAGADAEDEKGCFLVACTSWLAQSAFSQNPGPPVVHVMSWAHPQQPSTKKMYHKLAHGSV